MIVVRLFAPEANKKFCGGKQHKCAVGNAPVTLDNK